MARRRTVLSIPIPAGGVEVADVLAVLTAVAPSYDLARLEPVVDPSGEVHLVLTAGQRRLRPGALIDDELPGMDDERPPGPDPSDADVAEALSHAEAYSQTLAANARLARLARGAGGPDNGAEPVAAVIE